MKKPKSPFSGECGRLRQIESFVSGVVTREVDNWWTQQAKNPYEVFFLYYTTGDVKVAASQPEGYKLASAQEFASHMTKQRVAYLLRDILRRCPFLPA